MILGLAVIAGVLAGLFFARWTKSLAASCPQAHLAGGCFFSATTVCLLPACHAKSFPAPLAAASLVISQLGLLTFCILNWRRAGISILTIGLLLNFVVILANGGWMPISPETVAQLVTPDAALHLEPGKRLGASKDILLAADAIVFPWLADRFAPPDWIPYRFAFSVGDIFIGAGAFILLAFPKQNTAFLQKESTHHANQSNF